MNFRSKMSVLNCTATLACALPQLLVVRVTGEDRVKFLQGQLTNDVTRLEPGTLMTAGWCSPKGRLLTTPRLFADDDGIGMLIEEATSPAILKRLKMYVLRSKVSIEVDDTKKVLGILGAPEGAPIEAFYALTTGTPAVLKELGLPEGRGMVLADASGGSRPQGALGANSDDLSEVFWAASAAAGDPWVFGAAADQFVPQAVNLELAGGVSFSKGCYTGQEVVSRVEHIGKVSRRAALAIGATSSAPAPMSEVLDAAGSHAGVVVYAAAVGEKTAALVQLGASEAESASGAYTIEGVDYRLAPLPYGYVRQPQQN